MKNMKTINLIILFIVLTFNVVGQTSRNAYQVKGETDTYEIRNNDEGIFIYRVGIPLDDRAPVPDVPIKKYHLWPKKMLVDNKEYVKKYLLPYIEGEVTPDNSYLSISFYYELSTGKMKWITVYHKPSITIPIKAIERFEKVMVAEDKAIFNHSTADIKDIDFFVRWTDYDLYELKNP